MPVTFEGTDLAPVTLPPGTVGFGSAELVYLLAQHESAAAERSREVLVGRVEGISDPASPAFELVKAGASSLLARGLVEQDGTELTSKAEAAVLEFASANTERWTRVLMIGEHTRDLALVLQAPSVAVVLQPRSLGSWFAGVAEIESTPPELVLGLVEAWEQEHPEALFSVETWTLEAPPVALFLRHDRGADGWTVLDRSEDPANESGESMDEAALTARLGAILDRPQRSSL